MFLELGIFASQAIWLWRTRHIRREAKAAGKTYDEYIAAHPSKKFPRSESSDSIANVEAFHTEKEVIQAPGKCKTAPVRANNPDDAAGPHVEGEKA
jgi:hypothetical protein